MFGSEYVKHCARQLGFDVEFKRTDGHNLYVHVRKPGDPKGYAVGRISDKQLAMAPASLTAAVEQEVAHCIGDLLWRSVQP